MHDRFRKKYRLPAATERLRRQIALEAARRMLGSAGPRDETASLDWLDRMGENDYYLAKRKAAAVLGHRVRPGDLPTDSEVREQLVILWRSRSGLSDDEAAEAEPAMPEPGEGELVAPLAQHLDRFALYRMRLAPLEAIKQNPRYHPEGDALYHSLQVFERAREARPYDEEFLLSALLHDVGKAIDPSDHVASAVEALEMLQAWRPHVLLSDIGMPDGDGYELIQRVRELPEERGGRTPAAALTAYAGPFDRAPPCESPWRAQTLLGTGAGELGGLSLGLGREGCTGKGRPWKLEQGGRRRAEFDA